MFGHLFFNHEYFWDTNVAHFQSTVLKSSSEGITVLIMHLNNYTYIEQIHKLCALNYVSWRREQLTSSTSYEWSTTVSWMMVEIA